VGAVAAASWQREVTSTWMQSIIRRTPRNASRMVSQNPGGLNFPPAVPFMTNSSPVSRRKDLAAGGTF
jgi:hypothetical protein